MKIKVEIPQLRVVESCDTKGNPLWYLELFGAPALFAQPRTFPLKDGEVDGMTSEDWEDTFKNQLAGLLGTMLISMFGPGGWTRESPTGREVRLIDELEA